MERFPQKLERILKSKFKGAELKLERLPGSDRYTGFVIWSGFTRGDPMARQERLWKVLDAELTEAERHRIATLFTATPAEMSVSYD